MDDSMTVLERIISEEEHRSQMQRLAQQPHETPRDPWPERLPGKAV